MVDATSIPASHGGVARYIYGMLQGFAADSVELIVVCQSDSAETLAAIVPWATVRTTSPILRARPMRMLWEQIALPRMLREVRPDVLHSPHYSFPLVGNVRRVVTVHDGTFFTHPEMHNRVKRTFFRTWSRVSWRRADAVITPSQATADELARILGPRPDGVHVARLGVDTSRFHPPTPEELSAFRRDNDLEPNEQWFAFLGTIEPRKNVGSLLDAYLGLRAELGPAAPRLLIAGARGWDVKTLARLDALTGDSGVKVLGYVPLEHLAALLGGAVAVVYPSHAEGFGLPVVEAMSSGATVITTPTLAIPEVGGDAVVYSDPDVASLRKTMTEVLAAELTRADLSARAIARAATFDWAATAAAHLAAYVGGEPIQRVITAA
ncbi:MAG: glycosyltransferase family 4 protein [Leifsonia sp.]|uniref:glycosyltransferase family 4 protein n=1 Tax=Leifsonia sp. TaxID=1870902 RepID=UPI003F7FFEFC